MNLIHKIRIKARSLYSYHIFQRLGFPVTRGEQISKSVLKRFLPHRPVIIDCGAYDGSDSVEFVRILNAKVHSFEPVLEIFSRLRKNTSRCPGIRCYNLALSNQSGVQSLHVSEGGSDASSSLLVPKEHLLDHPETKFNKVLQVNTLTLDDWAKANNISNVDLLWLDMQGFELTMLSASKVVLRTVKAIHTEVSTKETYEKAGQYQNLKTFLEEEGFRVVVEAIPSGWDMGNVLFVRK